MKYQTHRAHHLKTNKIKVTKSKSWCPRKGHVTRNNHVKYSPSTYHSKDKCMANDKDFKI
jgi:hypothetical protein